MFFGGINQHGAAQLTSRKNVKRRGFHCWQIYGYFGLDLRFKGTTNQKNALYRYVPNPNSSLSQNYILLHICSVFAAETHQH